MMIHSASAKYMKNTVLHVLNEIGVQAVSNSGVASVASVGVRLLE